MRYKVAIIGAGPGGAVLARELAQKDIDVTIYEKGSYEELGHDWSDAVERVALKWAGLNMPELVGNEWHGDLVKETPDSEGVFEKHAIPRLKLHSPGYNSVKDIEFKMITTDRRVLGQMLVKQAEEAGVQIKYGYEGLGLLYRETGTNGPDGVEVYGVSVKNLENDLREEITADMVIESSGFHSVLRRSLPAYTGLAFMFKDNEFGFVNREVRERDPEKARVDIIPDHYRYGFHGGYQWSHIHNAERIDVGAGVKNVPGKPDPKDLIEEFIAKHPSIKNEKIRGGRGLCIVGPPLFNFVTNGFVIIGDAASTSVPTTGCGAGSAVLVGLWAAEVISEAAEEGRNDMVKLWDINKKFYLDNDRGASFAALSALRNALQTLDHDYLDFLFRQDIMSADILEEAVNGVFLPPAVETKAKSLWRGITKPSILAKLNEATGRGSKIYSHYRNYPPYWDPSIFARWQAEAKELLQADR